MKKFIVILTALTLILSAAVISAGAAPADLADTAAPTEAAAVKADPAITKVMTISGGLKPVWKGYEGAAMYRLFVKDGESWKKVADTAETSYAHKGLTEYASYVYTVRAMDKQNNYISGFDKQGYAFTYLPAPELKSIECVDGGVKIKWNAVKGAKRYKVYIQKNGAWETAAICKAAAYTDRNVAEGKAYTYTVRVCDEKNTNLNLSFYHTKGLSAVYRAAPEISGFTPVKGGTRVKWTATAGAAKYRLFYKSGTGWVKAADSGKTYADHLKLTDGKTYTYTVRAMDDKNQYISGFDEAGKAYTYIAPPTLTFAKKSGNFVLSWKAKTGAKGYRVYRKAYSAGWKVIGDTAKTTFTDKTYQKNSLYTYTVRCTDSSGTVNSYYSADEKYYFDGALADGKFTMSGKTLVFKKGVAIRQGYVTEGGKTYYYDANGVLRKNGVVGSKTDGYRYADKNGVVDLTYTGIANSGNGYWYFKNGVLDFTLRTAVTWGGSDWNVLNGAATKVSTAKDRTLHRALKLVAKITKPGMTKEQKLRKCFDYLQTETSESNPRVPHYRGMDWPVIYADDIFTTGKGNCFSYAAAFGFMAKAIGYEDIYACNSGGHGYTEIGGLIYDSEWQRNSKKYSYYGLSYSTKTDVAYASVKASMASGGAWMYVKI